MRIKGVQSANICIMYLLFSTVQINFDENGLSILFGDFFTNASGHPGYKMPENPQQR
jgi:hypothetical protein